MDLNLMWNCVSYCAIVALPLLVGLVYGFRRKVPTSNSFVFGVSEISVLRLMFPIAVLTVCPLALFFTVELQYAQASTWLFAGVGFLLAYIFLLVFIVPILHYSRVPSIYKYLEERYRSKLLKLIVCFVFLITTTVYTVLILSVISHVSSFIIPIQPWIASSVIGCVALCSIVIGGMSASTDISTITLILAGIGSFICMAIKDYRLIIIDKEINFSLDHEQYASISVYEAIPFGFVISLHFLSANQMLYQHYASVAISRRSRIALLLALPLIFGLFLLIYLVGIAVRGCTVYEDPFESFVMAIRMSWRDCAGMPGYLVGGVISYGLCSVPANFLAQSTVVWEDFLRASFSAVSEKKKIMVIQVLLITETVIIVAGSVSLLILLPDFWRYAKPTLVFLSIITAPVSALFLVGILFPCGNKNGAFFGLVVSLGLVMWLAVGTLLYQPHDTPKITTVHSCDWLRNATAFPAFRNATEDPRNATEIWNQTLANITSKRFVDSSTAESVIFETFTQSETFTQNDTTNEPSSTFLSSSTTQSVLQSTTTPTQSASKTKTQTTSDYPAETKLDTTISINQNEIANSSANDFTIPDTNPTNASAEANTTLLEDLSRESSRLVSRQEASSLLSEKNETINEIPVYYQISVYFLAPIGFLLCALITILVSILTGGQDVYTLDWNLVFWTCNDCTESLRFRRKKTQTRKRRYHGGGGNVASESFRYSNQCSLPETNYHNPKVMYLTENLTEGTP